MNSNKLHSGTENTGKEKRDFYGFLRLAIVDEFLINSCRGRGHRYAPHPIE
jgi:hypothetical protein